MRSHFPAKEGDALDDIFSPFSFSRNRPAVFDEDRVQPYPFETNPGQLKLEKKLTIVPELRINVIVIDEIAA